MKRPIEKISFNDKWALNVGKDRFIEELQPVYPGFDLGKYFDDISRDQKLQSVIDPIVIKELDKVLVSTNSKIDKILTKDRKTK